MARIKQRIERLETKRDAVAGNLSLLTDEELEKRLDALLTCMGTNREQVIAEHGSFGVFSHWLKCNLSDSARPVINGDESSSKEYMTMLG